jgi:hypothetical protein
MNDLRRFFLILLALGFLLALVVRAARPAAAQGEATSGWSEPVLVYALRPGQESVRAELVADDFGQLHVVAIVNSEEGGRSAARLYYTRAVGGLWSEPIDVVASGVDLPAFEWDRVGNLHLVWRNGEHLTSSIFAPLSAQEWRRASPYAAGGTGYPVVTGDAGSVHLLYPELGGSLFYTTLDTDGRWRSPINVSATAPGRAADWPRLTVDELGRLHAVWTELELPTGWPPLGVFYSRSEDGGNNWTEPFLVAGDGYDEINVAVGPNNTVHLAWNAMTGMGGRYHRYSTDGGSTWSETTTITAEGFTEGWPQMAVDAEGELHWLSSLRRSVTYTAWDGEAWSPFERVGANAAEFIGGERPRLALSQGNQLHALVLGEGGWWYSSRTIAAPAIAVAATPAPVPTATLAPTPTVAPTPTSSTRAMIQEGGLTEPPPASALATPGAVVWVGLIPAILFVLGVFVFVRRARGGRIG